ncbi:nitroreductase/quinone reductase family protein [Pseudonocardia acaciae]|uniref:nitroreductase/quinone reductase family protein n=1 Tax=Pseudonocardia acaciae TaxID=551276 RepID=UPI000A4C0E60|nr:nitroreductase/quinone reductase family protein [Pseudonocardia acaciae]
MLNPPSQLAAFFGLLPGHILIETVGRVTGKRRHTVVGAHLEQRTVWLVAEQGRHAGYVRNLVAHPRVRVRLGRRWIPGTATTMADDDPDARLTSFGNERHAKLVRRFGTALLTVRIELDPP